MPDMYVLYYIRQSTKAIVPLRSHPEIIVARAMRRDRVYSGDELMPSCLSAMQKTAARPSRAVTQLVLNLPLLGAGAALNKVAGRSVEGRHSVV